MGADARVLGAPAGSHSGPRAHGALRARCRLGHAARVDRRGRAALAAHPRSPPARAHPAGGAPAGGARGHDRDAARAPLARLGRPRAPLAGDAGRAGPDGGRGRAGGDLPLAHPRRWPGSTTRARPRRRGPRRSDGRARRGPRARLGFVHPLLRAAVHGDLPPARRRALHRAAATWSAGAAHSTAPPRPPAPIPTSPPSSRRSPATRPRRWGRGGRRPVARRGRPRRHPRRPRAPPVRGGGDAADPRRAPSRVGAGGRPRRLPPGAPAQRAPRACGPDDRALRPGAHPPRRGGAAGEEDEEQAGPASACAGPSAPTARCCTCSRARRSRPSTSATAAFADAGQDPGSGDRPGSR